MPVHVRCDAAICDEIIASKLKNLSVTANQQQALSTGPSLVFSLRASRGHSLRPRRCPMRRSNASELHLRVPQYSAEPSNAALRTPSIASSMSFTHRPPIARTMSTTSMLSSDGEGAMESDWTHEQEILLQSMYEKELVTFSHNNPPFVASAPPPALLGKVSKRTIKAHPGWPHSLAQTRKHLLLLVRRNAPEPSSPHIAPKKPTMNSMSAITNDFPGYFNNARGRSQNEMLNSPFDERTFDFDKPISPRKNKSPQCARIPRPDLMKEGSFGFGVPLTPSRKSSRISTVERPSSPSHSGNTTPTKKTPSKQPTRNAFPSISPTRRKEGDEGEVGRPGAVAGLMLSPRRSTRIKDVKGLKRTNSSLSITD